MPCCSGRLRALGIVGQAPAHEFLAGRATPACFLHASREPAGLNRSSFHPAIKSSWGESERSRGGEIQRT